MNPKSEEASHHSLYPPLRLISKAKVRPVISMAYTETLPTLMKAVAINGPGGHDQLQLSESVAVPKLSDGHVLVKNTYSGFNFTDIYLRTGLYPSASGFPLILGQEGAGTIVAVQGPSPLSFRPGDRVVWIGRFGYAEYTALH